jgi:hypothetical protein
MKLTSLSKTVRTIALIIAIASPSLQQPASAQAQNACSIASAQGPRGSLDGVNLTPTQSSAFDESSQRFDAWATRFNEKAKKVVKPNAPVGFFPKQGISSKLQETLSIEANNAKPAQIPSLTAKYGKYGRFIPETTLVYNQALFEEYERQSRFLQDQSLTVLSPAQRQKYQQNEAAFKRINKICGTQDGPFVKVGNSYEMGGSYF